LIVLPDIVLWSESIRIEIYGAVLELNTRIFVGTLILRVLTELVAFVKSICGVLSGSGVLKLGYINMFFAMQRFFCYYINTQ
jgi:hypothetical protein